MREGGPFSCATPSASFRGLQRPHKSHAGESDFFIDNLLVWINFMIEMIWWTGLAPWEFDISDGTREKKMP